MFAKRPLCVAFITSISACSAKEPTSHRGDGSAEPVASSSSSSSGRGSGTVPTNPPAPAAVCQRGSLESRDTDARPAWRAALTDKNASSWRLAASDRVIAARSPSMLIGIDPESGQLRFSKTTASGYSVAAAKDTILLTEMRESAQKPATGARYEGSLIGLSAKDGDETFRTPIEPHVDKLIVHDDLVYFSSSPTASKASIAYSIDISSGKIIWQTNLPDESELLAVDSDHAYVVGKDLLLALERKTGNAKWTQKVDLARPNDGLAVANGKVYLGFFWRMEARKGSDGSVVWTGKAQRGGDGGQVIVAHGDRVATIATRVFVHTNPPSPSPGDVGSLIVAFDENGRELFTHELSISDQTSGRRVAKDVVNGAGRIAVALPDRIQVFDLCGLDVSNLSLPAEYGSGLSIVGNRVYAILTDHTVIRLDI